MAPEGVTIEQMLVAMLSANPSAFIEGNVNRLRANADLAISTGMDADRVVLAEDGVVIDLVKGRAQVTGRQHHHRPPGPV